MVDSNKVRFASSVFFELGFGNIGWGKTIQCCSTSIKPRILFYRLIYFLIIDFFVSGDEVEHDAS